MPNNENTNTIRLRIEETLGGAFYLRFESGFVSASPTLRDRVRFNRYSTLDEATAAKERLEREAAIN